MNTFVRHSSSELLTIVDKSSCLAAINPSADIACPDKDVSIGEIDAGVSFIAAARVPLAGIDCKTEFLIEGTSIPLSMNKDCRTLSMQLEVLSLAVLCAQTNQSIA